jgi:uncharacterized protein
MSKRTLVLGASTNPERYSYKATTMLEKHGHKVFPIGLRTGSINDLQILVDMPTIEDVDTITLYIGTKNQANYYDYILHTIHPKRIIFNPGTENEELLKKAQKKGIQTEYACTLVLLSIGNY